MENSFAKKDRFQRVLRETAPLKLPTCRTKTATCMLNDKDLPSEVQDEIKNGRVVEVTKITEISCLHEYYRVQLKSDIEGYNTYNFFM